ncbi:MAG TPA: tetratricopeptide repeat protein [Candidatus Methylacidiphilales bacterium]|jgi:tetratricopeptide (TPR) repeat protein|nr:tetratricopeptide repeat protein [Candidatus Methylacidiphilales bacterium]
MSARFRYLSFAICASTLLLSPPGRGQQPAINEAGSTPAPAASSGLTTPTNAADKLIAEAVAQMKANNVDAALNDLSQAIKLNPSDTAAYVLRASIYYQKKQFTQSESDFQAAGRLVPNDPLIKFNLLELKFIQKQYDLARPGFVALEKDPQMGDLAAYKVFLCDLLGGRETDAKRELDAFTSAMDNASYEFSNAAWQLVHKNIEGDNGARYWLIRASHVYPPEKFNYYAQSLHDLGYLPLPAPPQQ